VVRFHGPTLEKTRTFVAVVTAAVRTIADGRFENKRSWESAGGAGWMQAARRPASTSPSTGSAPAQDNTRGVKRVMTSRILPRLGRRVCNVPAVYGRTNPRNWVYDCSATCTLGEGYRVCGSAGIVWIDCRAHRKPWWPSPPLKNGRAAKEMRHRGAKKNPAPARPRAISSFRHG